MVAAINICICDRDGRRPSSTPAHFEALDALGSGERDVSYYYVTVLHLFGYSVNGHISISIRVRVQYYFIFRDRYMK